MGSVLVLLVTFAGLALAFGFRDIGRRLLIGAVACGLVLPVVAVESVHALEFLRPFVAPTIAIAAGFALLWIALLVLTARANGRATPRRRGESRPTLRRRGDLEALKPEPYSEELPSRGNDVRAEDDLELW